MRLEPQDIAPELRPYVKGIFKMASDDYSLSAQSARVLPDTTVELFINTGKTKSPFVVLGRAVGEKCYITSRMSRFMDVVRQGCLEFISIWFYPGKAWPFFPLPMSELTNRVVPLTDLWGATASEMCDAIDRADTPEKKATVAQQYLIRALSHTGTEDKLLEFSLGYLARANGNVGVKQLARETGLSERQLLRKFDFQVGLSPKEYARVSRFMYSMRLLKSAPHNLTGVALEAGYYDQPHFIHEAQAIAGMAPSQMFKSDFILF